MRRTVTLLSLAGSLTLVACFNPNLGGSCTLQDTACGPADGSTADDGSGGDSSMSGPDGGKPDATLLDGGYDSGVDGGAHHDGSSSDGGEDANANVDSGVTCDGGLSYCPGHGCVPTDTVTNCGTCGTSCTAPTGGATSCVLDAGTYACAPTCDGGETDCSGECVTLTTLSHCGACGTSCTTAPDGGEPACVEDAGAYACSFACDTGEHACNGACYPNIDPPSASATGDSCIISPTYGVFVSPAGNNTTGTGTMTAPYLTIARALGNLGGKTRVYVCGGSYPENISLSAGVNLYGGLNCSTSPWTYNASNVATVNPSSGIPITVTGATAEIDDFAFQSATATTAGASSIAAFMSTANFTGVRCSFTAGGGAGSITGTFTANYTGVAPVGSSPDGGAGGGGGDNSSCGIGNSVGGIGGGAGGDGGTGTSSGPTMSDDAGYDGLGGHGGSHSCGFPTADPGANGAAGTPAASGAIRAGTLTSSGWTPQSGQNGATGNPGQGGGGGGGETAPATGGGGGGAGGCGGAGGTGGAGGGSSFALLSYQSTVGLYSCVLSAANGGAGAAGVPGQMGQAGAAGGLATCGGAYGGNGAGGGGGGGGAGGISATIGYVGTPPTYDSPTASHLTATGGGLGGGTALGGDGGSNGLPTAPSGLASTPAGLNGATSTTPYNLN